MFDNPLTSSATRWGQLPQSQTWSPPTDVYETDSAIVVKIEIAGLSTEDFSVSLAQRVLVVRGLRRDPASKLAYQRMEINYGHFHTEVHMPWPVDENSQIEATYEQGFLTVLLPKAPVRQVPVTGSNTTGPER